MQAPSALTSALLDLRATLSRLTGFDATADAQEGSANPIRTGPGSVLAADGFGAGRILGLDRRLEESGLVQDNPTTPG